MEKHRLVKPMSEPQKKQTRRFFRIPVSIDRAKNQLEFRMSEIDETFNENDKFFWLNFKTSDKDSLKRYVFGDIERSYDSSKDSESANYYIKKSFDGAKEVAKLFEGTLIEAFRKEFSNHRASIENDILRMYELDNTFVFIHFDFDGKHWHQLEEFSRINEVLLKEFTQEYDGHLALEKSLFKTLGGPVPGFRYENSYKTKLFADENEVMDLMFGVDVAQGHLFTFGDIKVNALPIGDHLGVKDLDKFFDKKRYGPDDQTVKEAEKDLVEANQPETESANEEPIFKSILQDVPEPITKFDIIFSKKGGSLSSPDIDVIELSGVNRSLLQTLYERISDEKYKVEQARKEAQKVLGKIAMGIDPINEKKKKKG